MATRAPCSAVASRAPCSAMASRAPYSAVATRAPCSAVATRAPCSTVATRAPCSAVASRAPCSAMAARAPCSAVGPGTGAVLEAGSPASCSLEASRAPTPPPRRMLYGAGRAFREGEVMSGSLCHQPSHLAHLFTISNLLITNHRHLSAIIRALYQRTPPKPSLSGLQFALLDKHSMLTYLTRLPCVYLPFLPVFHSLCSYIPVLRRLKLHRYPRISWIQIRQGKASLFI